MTRQEAIRSLAKWLRGVAQTIEDSVEDAKLQRERVRDFVGNTRLLPLVEAVIEVESNWLIRAVSPAGAQGLMQLMPAIQKAFKVKNPFSPAENIRGGEALLEEELARFKDLKLAVAAYNAGSPAIKRAIQSAQSRNWERVRQHLPGETQKYVPKVLARLPFDYSPFSA